MGDAMSRSAEFFKAEEYELGERFLKDGYVIAAVEDMENLRWIRETVAVSAGRQLAVHSGDTGSFLDRIHENMPVADLNNLRLQIINKLNTEESSRPRYYSLARQSLAALVGNELAMQLRLNLSIQFPGDDSSLLPVHADVWSGDSPFEVVVWLPLVDCHGSKSMFLLPPTYTQALHERFAEYRNKSSEDLYQDIKEDLEWIEIKYGEVLLFNQNLPHGNRVNTENETRWSINCRFKSVFSPYGDKKLGEFFEPVTLRPASRVGMQYRYPGSKT